MKRDREFFRGCLVGGATGDALGRPLEFMTVHEIVRRFGPGGMEELQLSPSGKAEISDDTQMTLFTAEGILRAQTMGAEKGACRPSSVVYHAYLRWLLTQGYPKVKDLEHIYDGWLINEKGLHARRGPGRTCLSALQSGKQGAMDEPINNSKGCGGVMRMAPAGLFYREASAFRRGAEFAALTHGHPSGYLPAGALAYMIALIIEGRELEDAANKTLTELAGYGRHEECTQKLLEAMELSKGGMPYLEAISRLGEGWVGEEALAIAVYCALKHRQDFKQALAAAVNHSGDSDSTGAITGNILGAYLGLSKIPAAWVDKIELREVLIEIADDLLTGHQDDPKWYKRYPGH